MASTEQHRQLFGRQLSNDMGIHTELRNADESSYISESGDHAASVPGSESSVSSATPTDETESVFLTQKLKDFFFQRVGKREEASERREFKDKTKKLVHCDQLWQEFRSEVDRHDVKTNMGVHTILQKFVADEMKEVSIDASKEGANAPATLCRRMLSFDNLGTPVETVRKGIANAKSMPFFSCIETVPESDDGNEQFPIFPEKTKQSGFPKKAESMPFLSTMQQRFSRLEIVPEGNSRNKQFPTFPEKTKQNRVTSSESTAFDLSRRRNFNDEAQKMKVRSLSEFPRGEIPIIPRDEIACISRQESNADRFTLRKPSSHQRRSCDRGEAYGYNKNIESQGTTTFFDTMASDSLVGSSLLVEWGEGDEK